MEKYASPLTWKQLTQYFCADAWHRLQRDKALAFGACRNLQPWKKQTEQAPSTQHRILLDMLPRGRKFSTPGVGVWPLRKMGQSQGHTDLPDASVFYNFFPKGAKIVHRQFHGGVFSSR